jgi:hypothetical protein
MKQLTRINVALYALRPVLLILSDGAVDKWAMSRLDKKQTPWPLVRMRTIPTPLIDLHLFAKFSANFYGYRGVAWSARQIPHGR